MRRIKTLHDEIRNETFVLIDGHEASDEELEALCGREEEEDASEMVSMP